MNCVIIAGGVPDQSDPLYDYSKGGPKALIDVAGRPMISWVLEALSSAKLVEKMAVVGLDRISDLDSEIELIPDQGSLVDNAIAGINWARASSHPEVPLVLCSADIPAITAEIVDNFLLNCKSDKYAVYYPIVPKAQMQAQYPQSNRTYVKLSDIEVAGGDLIVVHPQVRALDDKIWRAFTDARKHPWRLAQIMGPITILKYITHRLNLADATKKGEKILGYPVKALVTDLVELAMDVDKPHQLELLRNQLSRARLVT